MRFSMLLLIGVYWFAMQAGFARAADEPVNTPLPASVHTVSGFAVRIIHAPIGLPQNTLQRWVVHLDDGAGNAVTGARIKIDGGMPEHGHGFATAPSVTELGAGDYAVDGLKFHMPGYWEIGLDIRHGKHSDRAQFHAYLE